MWPVPNGLYFHELQSQSIWAELNKTLHGQLPKCFSAPNRKPRHALFKTDLSTNRSRSEVITDFTATRRARYPITRFTRHAPTKQYPRAPPFIPHEPCRINPASLVNKAAGTTATVLVACRSAIPILEISAHDRLRNPSFRHWPDTSGNPFFHRSAKPTRGNAHANQ